MLALVGLVDEGSLLMHVCRATRHAERLQRYSYHFQKTYDEFPLHGNVELPDMCQEESRGETHRSSPSRVCLWGLGVAIPQQARWLQDRLVINRDHLLFSLPMLARQPLHMT